MNHSLTALKKLIRGFNTKIFTVEDFWRICRREGIHVHFWQLLENVDGFYGLNRKYKKPVKYIVINQKLLPDKWLLTAFHELIHHFLHAPQSDLEVYFSKKHAKSREEKDADRFARMMAIPKPLLLEIQDTPFELLGEVDRRLLKLRWADFQIYGE
jgi:Zn-dependent peptidase ImmA (M78 family)